MNMSERLKENMVELFALIPRLSYEGINSVLSFAKGYEAGEEASRARGANKSGTD